MKQGIITDAGTFYDFFAKLDGFKLDLSDPKNTTGSIKGIKIVMKGSLIKEYIHDKS